VLTNPNPLVSCICPITKSREKYLSILFRSFVGQTYDRKELLLITEDDIDIPVHPLVRVIKCEPGLTVGVKRNIGVANAWGEVIAHFDSDDYSAPGRIEDQLRVMRQMEMPVTGYTSIQFYNVSRNEAYRMRPGPSSWACGTSLMYTKQYWQGNNFEERSVGEDTIFCKTAAGQTAIFSIDGGDKIVALDHDTNTSPRGGGETHEYNGWYYLPVADVEAVRQMLFPTPKKIALSLMVWNTKDISLENVEALKAESKRLKVMGYDTEVIVLDNGSSDGFIAALKKQKHDLAIITNKTNKGSSVGRNQIIDRAIKGNADYLLFNDGDITCVPWSIVSTIKCMESDASISCLGAFWDSWSDDPVKCSPHWSKRIVPMKCDIIAPTQYGVWRRDLFQTVRFDEGFGPGWGWEDDDLFLSMKKVGFVPSIFIGMTYLHRHIHHGHHGHANADELYNKRREYMIAKWKDEVIAAPHLQTYRNAKPPTTTA
jgi:glycosyltransferase involved in cell wall biosynthesis